MVMARLHRFAIRTAFVLAPVISSAPGGQEADAAMGGWRLKLSRNWCTRPSTRRCSMFKIRQPLCHSYAITRMPLYAFSWVAPAQ